MKENLYSKIRATGSYIPQRIVKNEEFADNEFYDEKKERIEQSGEDIIRKFKDITGISERRYVIDEYVASDIAYFAAQKAIESAEIDKESLDYIIVAHNFGDVLKSNPKTDMVPTLAARVKHNLKIENPYTVAYDLPFGCPGWLQAFIQADYYIKSGDAKRIMVIGAETLSRIFDPHDRDGMIYSDGAGAIILEAVESDTPVGVLSHLTRSDTLEHANLLRMDVSYNPDYPDNTLFLKMQGRKLYEYALNTVPRLVKDCIEKSGLTFPDIKKILIHQANEKMDQAILLRILRLYGVREVPEDIMPMSISMLGNNSVATLPILMDLIVNGKLEDHKLNSGDNIVFASVGAGMNVNAMVYRMP